MPSLPDLPHSVEAQAHRGNDAPAPDPEAADRHCPVCGAALVQEKCKVVCRSPRCTYRIVFNCSEF